MVKSELIHETWKTVGKDIEKSKVERTVNTFINILGKQLKNGQAVKIEGLGSFCPYYKTYIGKDVTTGKQRKIENEKHIRFKPSSKIK
ncbi:MAG: HU family DNA-binding protein [Lachnospiraceae bacterium]